MTLSTRQTRAVLLSQHRLFTDTICWIILFLLIIGFHTIYLLWHQPGYGTAGFIDFVMRLPAGTNLQPSWPEAFVIILMEASMYTLGMMMVVYFNLLAIKPNTLEQKNWSNGKRYATYIILVTLASLAFSLVMFKLASVLGLVRSHFNFPINILANFSFSFISTGLLYLRNLKEKERILSKAAYRNRHLASKLQETREALEDAKEALADGVAFAENHIKIGNRNNYRIVPFDSIVFFKGEGNEPRIMLTTGKRPFAGSTLKEFEDRLPEQQFIRVHRSYIVNKDKVIGRNSTQLILFDDRLQEEFYIPISDKYLGNVDADKHQNLHFEEFNSKTIQPTENNTASKKEEPTNNNHTVL